MLRSTPLRRVADGVPGRGRRWLTALGLGLVSLAVVVLLAVGGLLHLPAAALAPAVADLSGGQLRFAVASGRLAAGRGELWVRDAAGRDWQPWMPVEWQLTSAWDATGPALLLTANFASVRVDRLGLTTDQVRLHLPPSLLLRAFDHPLASAPWRGDIGLTANGLHCPWSGLQRPTPRCEGQAFLQWRGMASPILPMPELGTFMAAISADSRGEGRWRAELSTEHGLIALSGHAELSRGVLDYRLRINGAAVLLADLDNVVGTGGYRRGETGEFILESAR